MSLMLYRVLHLFGVALLLSSLGGLCALSAGRLTGSDASADKAKRIAGMLHGIALVVVLVTGFGGLAKLGMSSSMGVWVYLKIAIWLVFGGSLVMIRRSASMAARLLWLLPILAGVAAYLAIYKPGM